MKFKNNVGYTPLHLAAKLGYVRVVEELLAVGANAALKDKVGFGACPGIRSVDQCRSLIGDANDNAEWKACARQLCRLRAALR